MDPVIRRGDNGRGDGVTGRGDGVTMGGDNGRGDGVTMGHDLLCILHCVVLMTTL
jgi:hypothetical protein